jgi:hypothetical protein
MSHQARTQTVQHLHYNENTSERTGPTFSAPKGSLSLKDHFLQKILQPSGFLSISHSIQSIHLHLFRIRLLLVVALLVVYLFLQIFNISYISLDLDIPFLQFRHLKSFFLISSILRILVHDRKFCRVLDNNCCSWCL